MISDAAYVSGVVNASVWPRMAEYPAVLDQQLHMGKSLWSRKVQATPIHHDCPVIEAMGSIDGSKLLGRALKAKTSSVGNALPTTSSSISCHDTRSVVIIAFRQTS